MNTRQPDERLIELGSRAEWLEGLAWLATSAVLLVADSREWPFLMLLAFLAQCVLAVRMMRAQRRG